MDRIDEFRSVSDTDDRREIIKQKFRQYYDAIENEGIRKIGCNKSVTTKTTFNNIIEL